MKHPSAVTACNLDLENLITDVNRSIATLAITTLLKVRKQKKLWEAFANEICYLNIHVVNFSICEVSNHRPGSLVGKDVRQLRWPSGIERLCRAVDSGLIPSRVKPLTLKLVFTTSLLDAQH